jgi:hypothetical protein
MRAFLLIALAALAVAFPSPAGSRVTNTVTFNDPELGDPNVPDIGSVTISDAANGQLTFTTTVRFMPPNAGLFFLLDTDRNAATGWNGADYEMEIVGDNHGGVTWDIERWDENVTHDWVSLPETSTMGVSMSGTTQTIRVGQADLGGTTSFAFWVVAIRDVGRSDRLPDGGTLVYDLSPPTPPAPPVVVPVLGKPALSPVAPIAGKRLTVTFPVTDAATGAPLTSGTMTCDPQVSGRVLPHSESFGNGAARLTFTIPKSAKGKLLKVNLAIRVGTKVVRTAPTFRVR